jgi:Bacterial membrane protein YfhO
MLAGLGAGPTAVAAPTRDGRWRRAVAWGSARPALAAAIVYAVLSLIMVGPGLLPGRTLSSSDYLWSAVPWTSSAPDGVRPLGSNYEMSDTAVLVQPFLRYTRADFPDVPLWNPHLMSGRPLLADGQSAPLAPFNLPAYVLPFWKSLAIVAFLKLFVAAFGTYLFARKLGMRFGGALLAGVVFAFGTFMVVWLGWPLSNVFALLPWLLLLTEVLVRSPGPLPVAGLAGVVGLQYLGGHPESNFHVLFATAVFFAFRALLVARRRGGLRAAVRPTLLFGVAIAGGTALAALFVLPFVELLIHSGDYANRLDHEPSFAPREQFGALFLHDYWGRPTQSEVKPFVSNRGWYAGALTLMLAAAAVLLRPTATRLAVVVFAAFSVLMVLGLPPVFTLVVELPGFRTANNGKMVILFLMCVALLAGWGLDDLSARRPPAPGRARLVLLATAGIFCVPLVWMAFAGTIALERLGSALEVAWGFADSPPVPFGDPAGAAEAGDTIRMSSLLQWLPLAGAGVALVAMRLAGRKRLPVAAFVGLVVALVAADLFRANMGFNPAIPIANAAPPETGALRYLESRRPNRFVGVAPADPATVVHPLPPNIAMSYGLYDVRGFDYPVERRYARLWRQVPDGSVGGDIAPHFATVTPRSLRVLSLLSVADLIQGRADERPRGPGLRVAYDGPDGRVYANERALPRVFLVDRQRIVADGDAALAAVTSPAFDGTEVAITERAIPGVPGAAGGSPGRAGSARLVSYDAERAAVEVRAARRSVLVLTDTYFPGWEARVDGAPVDIERVDYVLRGVPVPAGAHRVEFSYEPASWRVGWIVALLAAIALAATAAIGLRARRR